MLSQITRRSLSLVMALALVVSLFPLGALAEEAESQMTTTETASPAEATVPSVPETLPSASVLETIPVVTTEETSSPVNATDLAALKQKMDDILLRYLGKTVMTEEEVLDAVNAMVWDDMQSALDELNALEAEFSSLSEEDVAQLEEHYPGADTIVWFYETLQLVMTPSFFASATGSHTPVTGVTVDVSGATDNSMSSGTITVTAQGTAGFLFFPGSSKTATIIISNSSGSGATISFDWEATSVNELTIDGTKYTGTSSSFSKALDAGASITVKITTSTNSTINTLKLKNFSIIAAQASSKVTFIYTAGDVKVAGTSVGGSGKNAEISSEGADIVTTGSNFIAWVNDADNKIVSTTASFKLKPTSDMTIRALFGPTACFQIGAADASGYMFDDLNKAAAFAATSASPSKTVVLANNGTLSAGDYSILGGVTLLIPFDTANTLYTSQPASVGNSYSTPTAFRTLTMAKNAKIEVESTGAISVSGKHSGRQPTNGAPSGPQGFINMNSDSSIVIKNGATLYAWGYITGSGSVTIKNGATVYECFQVTDWRGGDCTNTLNSNKSTYRLFPFSQYYIQNVEVPMTLEAGASEICYFSIVYTSISLSGTTVKTESAPANFIGTGGLFLINSGSVTKDYDETTDRLIFDINGTVTLSTMTIRIKPSFLSSTITISSSGFDFPLNSNVTVNVKENHTVNIQQDVAMHPGAVINIEKGAVCNISENVQMVLYDQENWGNYVYISGETFKPVTYAPNRKKTRTDADLVSAKVLVNGIVNADSAQLYTTANGANICSEGTGSITFNPSTCTRTVIKQVDQGGEGNDEILEVYEIELTPAKLKNEADSSYLETASATAVTTYNYDHHNCEHGDSATDGVWYAGEHDVVETVIAPTTTSKGYTSHTCACGHAYNDNEVPALVDGVIYGTNIRIGDTLDLHFYINRSVLDPLIQEGKTYKAVLTREYVNSEGNSDTSDKTYQQAEWEVYSSKYYRVSYDGFAAKEMTDDVHITIYEADTGYQVSETKTDSIRGYAVRSLKNTNNPDALRRTVIDMLNYGASAQEHFLYKTGDLANTGDSVIAENAQYASESASYALDSTNENSDSFYGLNISLKSDLYLNFYFYNVTEDMTADFSYIKHNNSKTSNEYPIPYNDFGSGKDENGVALKGVKVKGLGIADGRTDVTCTLSNGQTATASVEGYIAATIAAEKKLENPSKTLIAVCENLMKFIDSANAYFK